VTKNLDPEVRRELGEMIKISSNEMASKYSHELGLKNIQGVLDRNGLYDKDHGGGIWVGKHYGRTPSATPARSAATPTPSTVRQLLRFYLLLEQGKLLSPEASKSMREIFQSPDIKHLEDKFVKGLKVRDLQIIRKSGWWEEWRHDTAVVSGPGRHYILVALTEHKRGEEYLEAIAPAIDDVMKRREGSK
jgi:beta-lactamase class A